MDIVDLYDYEICIYKLMKRKSLYRHHQNDSCYSLLETNKINLIDLRVLKNIYNQNIFQYSFVKFYVFFFFKS